MFSAFDNYIIAEGSDINKPKTEEDYTSKELRRLAQQVFTDVESEDDDDSIDLVIRSSPPEESQAMKRQRTEGEGYTQQQRIAMAIAGRIKKKYPYKEFGTAFYRRGTPSNIARFGETYKSADAEQRQLRKDLGYIGRGRYNPWRSFVSGVKDIGHLLGPKVTGALENKLVSKIAGMGAYSGRGAYNNLIVGGRPSMTVGGSGDETQSIIISHCEYMQDVYGSASSAFSVESWSLNPGLSENFPWLAQIAANYEEYEFVQLLFHYKSTVDASAINNTNGSTGTIIMATNYNPGSGTFTSKETMMQYHGAISGRVVEDHTHGVECDPEKNAGAAQKYIRTQPVVVNQDVKTFDLGTFQLGQTNIPSAFQNQQIGELWVSYTVKCTKPRLHTAIGNSILESRWLSSNTTNYNPTNSGNGMLGGGSGSAVGGTWAEIAAPLTMQQNSIPLKIEQQSTPGTSSPAQNAVSNLRITLPDFLTGTFEILVSADGSGIAMQSLAAAGGGSVTVLRDMLGGAGAPESALVVSGFDAQLISVVRFRVAPIVAGADNTLTLFYTFSNSLPFGGTFKSCSLWLRQVNGSLGQSNSNALPLYVNTSGSIVTVPTAA